MNDQERAQWIDNDEGLYTWWRGSGQSKRAFIREHRDELTRLISAVLDGDIDPHALAYETPERHRPHWQYRSNAERRAHHGN